jgi:hypothetical protein
MRNFGIILLIFIEIIQEIVCALKEKFLEIFEYLSLLEKLLNILV